MLRNIWTKKVSSVLLISLPTPGAVICATIEYEGGTECDALGIEEKIHLNTRAVLSGYIDKGIVPRQDALDIAVRWLKKVIVYRRCSLFSSA